MKKLIEFLYRNPVQYCATVGLDGNPKCRPFQFMFEIDGKLWFCTGNKKEVYKELQANPNLEISVNSSDNAWCRISGEAHFENNLEVKQMVLDHSELVKGIYKTADNPVFEVFYIENGSAIIVDLSGNPPQVFDL